MLKELLTGQRLYTTDPGGGEGGTGAAPAGEVKQHSQEDVDRIISVRLERERAKHQEELAKRDAEIKALGFESYDDVARLKGERDEYEKRIQEYEAKLTRNERINKVKKLGVDDEFIDYVLYKVQDDEALEDFLKENPRFTAESFNTKSSNFKYKGGGTKKLEDATTDEEYLEIRRRENNE